MNSRVGLAIFTFLAPAAANACGGGDPDYVGIAVLIALFIAMTSAFLVPLAGMLALKLRNPLVIVRLFVLYGAITVAAALSAILTQPSDIVTIVLILLCAVLLVAPSVHYFVYSMQTSKANTPDRATLEQ